MKIELPVFLKTCAKCGAESPVEAHQLHRVPVGHPRAMFLDDAGGAWFAAVGDKPEGWSVHPAGAQSGLLCPTCLEAWCALAHEFGVMSPGEVASVARAHQEKLSAALAVQSDVVEHKVNKSVQKAAERSPISSIPLPGPSAQVIKTMSVPVPAVRSNVAPIPSPPIVRDVVVQPRIERAASAIIPFQEPIEAETPSPVSNSAWIPPKVSAPAPTPQKAPKEKLIR